MKLTKEQIEIIENHLQKKGINYVDIRHEILDHIILDVENLIKKNHNFLSAFNVASIKWEKYFKERSSFYFGFYFSNSKIVLNKAIKVFKPFYILYMACYFFPVFILRIYPISINASYIKIINNSTVLVCMILLIYSFLIYINILKLKHKTVFSFIINTQFTGLLFLLITFLVGGIVDKQGELSSIFLGLTFAGFAVVFIIHHFYTKHKEVLKKYALL